MDCVAANVFDLLPQLEKEPVKYDFIILDPAGLHQKPENRSQRHHRLQGDQLPGHEAAAPGRVSGHLLLLPLCHGGEVRGHAPLRRP